MQIPKLSQLIALIAYLLFTSVAPAQTSGASSAPKPKSRGFIYVSNQGLQTADVVRASDNVRVASVPAGNIPFGVTVSNDGKTVYVSNWAGSSMSVIDTATDSLRTTVPLGSQPREVTLTPDGAFVYVPDYIDNVVYIVSTATNTVTAKVPVGTQPA